MIFETEELPIVNKTMNLADCAGKWEFDHTCDCWCLEDILYTPAATTPKFQRMSIFVPKEYLHTDGTLAPDGTNNGFTAKTAPVIFENNSAGYMQMPHTWLGGPRDEASKYLKRGMVYVTCGCRGRESLDADGTLCGKSPWTLVDLKTAIRFLRHNAAVLPGDINRIISVGWSAGGAMSSLIGVTGNHSDYLPFLEQNGAFLEERDDVYAAMVYCPIIDLEHADLAYEWQFQRDPENENSPAGPAGIMTPFQGALSKKLAASYVTYFNGLKLVHPKTGDPLILNADQRSGSAYNYLMELLESSATDFFSRLESKSLQESYSAQDYLNGNYTCKTPAPMPAKEPDSSGKPDDCKRPATPPSLGDLVSRPPRNVPYRGMDFSLVDTKGKDKHAWLSWDGKKAAITSLDDYLLQHRRRMKPCTSFDKLEMDSGENQEFGTAKQDYMHFDEAVAPAIAELKEEFSKEYEQYYDAFAAAIGDEALNRRRELINPLHYIGTGETCDSASHFRIRTGACDADTAFTVSMTLALKLAAAGKKTDYALVWDKPHCQADYPFEVCDWIEEICR